MPSTVPRLLSAAAGATGQLSRSTSSVVAKAARGFHVFCIDGYSWTKTLPAGERVSSQQFTVGGRCWRIDYYPNGATDTEGSAGDSVALYLRLVRTEMVTGAGYSLYNIGMQRVRAQYRFSLLDLDGNEAYEVPAETGIFTNAGHGGKEIPGCGCGYASFISKDDLEVRRETLLKADSLAVRCDVGVTEVLSQSLAGTNHWRRRR